MIYGDLDVNKANKIYSILSQRENTQTILDEFILESKERATENNKRATENNKRATENNKRATENLEFLK